VSASKENKVSELEHGPGTTATKAGFCTDTRLELPTWREEEVFTQVFRS
jgi:hypothetical protein